MRTSAFFSFLFFFCVCFSFFFFFLPCAVEEGHPGGMSDAEY